MHFAPDADEETLLRELDIPLNTPVALPKGTEISKILRDICTEYYSARLHRTEITVQYFRILFYRLHEQLVRVNAVQDGSSDSGRLRQIKDFIFRKPFDRFEAARFADALNLSEDAFLQQYAADNGSSFADDLIHTRLCYIAEQMKVHLSENQTAEEIAQLCGYAGEDEFSAEFSRFIGKSPQQYLDELRA